MVKEFKCSDCEKTTTQICPSCWKCLSCCNCNDRKTGKMNGDRKNRKLEY